jgi:hypothetical protein
MIIDGGTGTGYKAEVDNQNRLASIATMETALHHASVKHGLAFSWTAVSADLAGGDTGLLVCNDDPDRLLHVDSLYVWSDVPTQFKIHFPVYSASFDGTAVTGLNLNRTSNVTALATAFADETANAFVAANTVLTIKTNELTTDQFGIIIRNLNGIILGYHDSVAVDVVADSAAFECSIWAYYEKP